MRDDDPASQFDDLTAATAYGRGVQDARPSGTAEVANHPLLPPTYTNAGSGVKASSPREWLIASDLVLHYVAVHSYRPPDSFVEAVMARRVSSTRSNSLIDLLAGLRRERVGERPDHLVRAR
ncbi:DUF7919 family protein [Streptomyces werraensis]